MTATYSKPTAIPRWADTSTNILEPPELKKDEGWLFEEIPPSAFENWRTNLIGSWAKWLDERLFDGASKDEFLIKSPGAGTEAVRITDTYVKVSRDLRVEGDDLGVEVDGTTSRRIYFDSSKLNWLGYSIGGSRMELYAGGVLALWADATQCYINGDIVIGDDLSVPGGLAVGIASPTYADDVIQLGDADNRWEFNSGNPRFVFDHFGGSIDALTFDRTNSKFAFSIANTEEFSILATGAEIANGLNVGFSGTPADDKVCVGDANCHLYQWSTYVALSFDSGDVFQYARTSNELSLLFGSAEKFRYTATGMTTTGGIHAGALTGIAGAGRITSSDLIQAGTSVRATTDLYTYSGILYLSNDNSDSIQWDGTNLKHILNTAEEMRLTAAGLAIANGLYVGDIAGTPVDNAIIADGAGGFGTALRVGFAGTSILDDLIEIGDSNFYLRLQSGNPTFVFDSNDGMSWDRSTNTLTVTVNVAPKFYFNASGLSVANGIHVGSLTSAVDDTITSELHGVFWGGLRVGFSGVPTNDRIELGDADMFLQFNADVCEFDFASGASFSFSRTNSRYAWLISTIEEMRLTANGLSVGNGLYVGDVTGTPVDNSVIAEGDGVFAGGLRVGFAGTPTADRIELGDTIMFLQYSATPYLQFDTGDQFGYDRAADRFWFVVGTSEEMRVRGDGVAIANGLYVGNLTGVPTDDQINIADGNFYLKLATNPYIYFDALDYLDYDRSSNALRLFINSTQVFAFYNTLIRFYQPTDFVGASPISWSSPGANPTTFGATQSQQYTGKLVTGDGTNTARYLGTIHQAYEINRTTTGIFSTATIPANTLAAGSRIHAKLRVHGLVGTTSWSAAIKINGTQVGQCGGVAGAVGEVDVEAIVASNPGGSVNVYTSYLGLDSGGASHSISYQLIGVATNANVTVTAELTFASGTPSVTLRTYTVEVN